MIPRRQVGKGFGGVVHPRTARVEAVWGVCGKGKGLPVRRVSAILLTDQSFRTLCFRRSTANDGSLGGAHEARNVAEFLMREQGG